MACAIMKNYVGKLQEILNRKNFPSPQYDDPINNNNNLNLKKVSVEFKIGENSFITYGEGMNKKEAKQLAAKNGLCELYYYLNNDGSNLTLKPDYFTLIEDDLADYKRKKSENKSTQVNRKSSINKPDDIIINNHFKLFDKFGKEKNPFEIDSMSTCSSLSSISSKNDQKQSSKQQYEKKQNILQPSKKEQQTTPLFKKEQQSTPLFKKEEQSTPLFKKEQQSIPSFKKEESKSSIRREQQSKKSNPNSSRNNKTNDLRSSASSNSNWRESEVSNNKTNNEISSRSTNSNTYYARAPNEANGFTQRKSSPLKRLEINDDFDKDKKFLKLKDFKTKKHNETTASSNETTASSTELKESLNDLNVSLNESTSSTGTEILNRAKEINNLRQLDLRSQMIKISQLDIIKDNNNLAGLKNLSNSNMNDKISTPIIPTKATNLISMNDHFSDNSKDFSMYWFNNRELIKEIIESNPSKTTTNKKIIENLVIYLPSIKLKLEYNIDRSKEKKIYSIQLMYNCQCIFSAHYACGYDDENGEEICSERLVNCIKLNI